MTKVVVIEKFGGPEVLQWREESLPAPGSGEVLVRHTAVGLNFIDVYQRTGLYPLELPAHLGLEAAGEVLAVGQGVAYVSPGDRVTCTWSVLQRKRRWPSSTVARISSWPMRQIL